MIDRHEHIAHDVVDFKDIAPCIGMAALTWPVLEQTLDTWINLIHHHLGGKHLERCIPLEFRRKAQYLNRAFVHLPVLQPYSCQARRVIAEAQEFSKLRHYLIHGAVKKYDPVLNAVLFVKIDIDRKADIHVESQKWISMIDLLHNVIKWQDLVRRSADLGVKFLNDYEMTLRD